MLGKMCSRIMVSLTGNLGSVILDYEVLTPDYTKML